MPGVTSRVDYLAALGIDAVWLSPFYPSALADGGYDVDDYRDVDPRLGTLDDFDAMVAALHAAGIRVVVDIVPNHTSNRHAWFQEALARRAGIAGPRPLRLPRWRGPRRRAAADRLGARCSAAPPGTRVRDGQWYLHFFAAEQPDLNWQNPEVREDFVRTLRFWSDRGVDGFRIDVAHMLTKDLTEPLPSQAELDAMPKDGSHPLSTATTCTRSTRSGEQVFNEYDPPRTAVAEAWVERPRSDARTPAPRASARRSTSTCSRRTSTPCSSATSSPTISRLAAESGSSSTWVLSNHDVVRHATRYGLPPAERGADGRPLDRQGNEWLLSRRPHT